MPNVIVEIQNCSLDGHSPKFALPPWQVWIDNCILFANESMQQSAVAGHLGLTRVNVNCILGSHAVTVTLVPGKSTGALPKTTPRQNCVLLRMVHNG